MDKLKTSNRVGERSIGITIMLLICFSLLMTIILELTDDFEQLKANQPDWSDAQWLEYPQSSDVLYLRKSFVLDAIPEWAVVTVSAVDNFVVFVNGQALGEKKLPGGVPEEIFDITSLLKPGKNTLAIRAVSSQKHMQSRAIATLQWQHLGKIHRIGTNQSWRVSNKEEIQNQGKITWNQQRFIDNEWHQANVLTNFNPEPTEALIISANNLSKLHSRNRYLSSQMQLKAISLSNTFIIEATTIQGAWIGINVEGKLQIAVNQFVFNAQFGAENKVLLFSLKPYLKSGENKLYIQILNPKKRLFKIGLSGLVSTSTGDIDLSAKQAWDCYPQPCELDMHTVIAGQLPRLKWVELSQPKGYAWAQWQKRLSLGVQLFCLSLFVAGMMIALLMQINAIGLHRASVLFAQPLTVINLLLILLLLIVADPRFASGWLLTAELHFWIPFCLILLQVSALFSFCGVKQRKSSIQS